MPLRVTEPELNNRMTVSNPEQSTGQLAHSFESFVAIYRYNIILLPELNLFPGIYQSSNNVQSIIVCVPVPCP